MTYEKMSEREFVRRLCEVTGMNYCDKDCDCGDNAELMFWPVAGDGVPEWLPDWTNGAGYMEVYEWIKGQAPLDANLLAAVKEVGLPLS